MPASYSSMMIRHDLTLVMASNTAVDSIVKHLQSTFRTTKNTANPSHLLPYVLLHFQEASHINSQITIILNIPHSELYFSPLLYVFLITKQQI